MPDHHKKEGFYDLLGLPVQAAIDEQALQQAYTEKSRLAHPDHGGDEQQAAAVNLAYETLRSPEKRLKYLLESSGPEDAKNWRTVPLDNSMMDVFSRLGRSLEGSKKLIEKKNAAQSELLKALLAAETFKWRDELENTGFEIETLKVTLLDQLPALDAALASQESAALGWKELAMVQARLAYLARWQGQIREQLLQLM